jgi:hypothetical protein
MELVSINLQFWLFSPICYVQGLDFDDMSSFFSCEIDNAGFKNSYFIVHFFSFCVVFKLVIFVILAPFSCHIFKVYYVFK